MSTSATESKRATALDVRQELVEALELDLVGPGGDHSLAAEFLPGWTRPSNWYLTGFLVPSGSPPEDRSDPDEQDDLGVAAETAGPPEESAEERRAAKRGFFPSSIGLSFLVPPGARSLEVAVRWGDYAHHAEEPAASPDGDTQETVPQTWRRTPREERVELELGPCQEICTHQVPGSLGLELCCVERTLLSEALDDHLPKGTRSVSVFLVNRREARAQRRDEAFCFQPQLEISCASGFVARPDLSGMIDHEWDEQVADLHYADASEYASGHGVSAEWQLHDDRCVALRTAWIPRAEVEKTETVAIPDVVLEMDTLGSLSDGDSARSALLPLVERYRRWLLDQHASVETSLSTSQRRQDTARELLRQAGLAADRIERGIEVLAEDNDALDAFRVANRAVGHALRQRLDIEQPSWRAFQLAFVLLNLPGIADPADPNRKTVDLLFFPTGGGKTEAYLGLAAFTMVLRRLRHPGDEGLAGAGVSVIMRYTLRLLTLDQLGRAAGLVCALELERSENPRRYGSWPFEIGLWVGQAATPNLLGKKGDNNDRSARAKVARFKRNPKGNPAPIPLEECPWCKTEFTPQSFSMLPNNDRPRDLRVGCANFECDFSGDRPLPIVGVDEPLYRRLPAFLIATVDKFASLPWVAQSGALLGGAERYDQEGFYGAAEPGRGKRLAGPLPPPDLVIQDELHLISGPLGTMAGLYETAIEGLCCHEVEDPSRSHPVRPKIIASTATVRRAQDQIQALFGRPLTQVFPPPGPDCRDSFFARVVASNEAPARLYLGIAAQGRNPKVLMRRTWLALMGAAERAYREHGGHENENNPADPYMTVLGYFNSLRELGGARRILEEEVQNTVKKYGSRRRIGETADLFRNRSTFSQVVELTSRVSTDKVAEARRRLESGFHERDRVDCAIATNMISVGLDIPRLGLMVVLGQPKTSSEYIQATSRVGRDREKPGLVVTLLNAHKARDRSHYERFRHYHDTFYRSVEAASVTPFSARALDRGFAGAMVALARHLDPVLTPPKGVERLASVRVELERRILALFLERVRQQRFASEEELEERLRGVQNRVVETLDAWQRIVADNQEVGVEMKYQQYEAAKGQPLLREMLEREFESLNHRKFRANRSLRDVEPEVNLIVKELDRWQGDSR